MMYGIGKAERRRRISEVLALVELEDKAATLVEKYSGGMKRRLEIARGLLHHPKVLFLDEPTLGLDPQTRRLIWDYLLKLRETEGLTIFLTTHYMDEAEHADRIAVIDHGNIVGLDTPNGLKRGVGGDLVTISAPDNQAAATEITEKYRTEATARDGTVSFSVTNGAEFLPDFVRSFSQPLQSVTVREPTLDDVFLHLTGREIRDSELDSQQQLVEGMARRFGGRR
jgi:ABC-2 type transport system ATP-binding protein